MRHPSTLENKYSNIFFYKTIAPTVLKFYMEHLCDLIPAGATPLSADFLFYVWITIKNFKYLDRHG